MSRKFSRASLVAFALSVTALGGEAGATSYVAQFHGTVLSGFDSLGVFGGGDLTGLAYSARFEADFTPATLVTDTGSAIAVGGTPSSTPIFARLTIRGHRHDWVGGFIGLFGLGYNDPVFGNGVALQAVSAPFSGLANEVENFDPLRPILNENFVTPTTYQVQPTDTRYGFFAIDASEFGYLAPSRIDVRAVPEPGTWAMMIAGLGLIGFAMRRRADRGVRAGSSGSARG